MSRYRRKSAEIEARQFTQNPDVQSELAEWCGGTPLFNDQIDMPTIHGIVQVTWGDWIVPTRGGFRKYSQGEFADEFEPVDADAAFDTLPWPLNAEEAAKRDAGGDYRAADGKLVGYCPPAQS